MAISLKLLVTLIYLQFLSGGRMVIADNESEPSRTDLHFRVERIETDLILFRTGANINMSYNETAEYPGQAVSSPGCPKSHHGRPWVYYGSPPRCYLIGFYGPCQLGKRLFHVPNSKYGVCNCDCFTQEVSRQAPQNPSSHSTVGIIDYSQIDISQNLLLFPRRRVRSHNSNSITFARMINNPYSFFERRKCNYSIIATTMKPTPAPVATVAATESDEMDSEITSYFLNKPSKLVSQPDPESKDRYSFCFSNWYKRQVVYDALRQECTPFLDQGPCKKGEWLVRDLDRENGVTCEKRKCPEIISENVKPELGGSYSYFDYRRQSCITEIFGNLEESFFANAGSIIPRSNSRFCRDAGMRYSQRLKTCVRDVKQFEYKVIR